ncbi:MAG: hypothetical protein ACTSVO_04225 [Candidatus Heimdallarchaeaceae archaeon]
MICSLIYGIMYLRDGNLFLGLISTGIGSVLLLIFILWIIRKIKRFKKSGEVFFSMDMFSIKALIFFAFTSVLAITVGILLFTVYNYILSGVITMIFGLVFLIPPVLELVLSLKGRHSETKNKDTPILKDEID